MNCAFIDLGRDYGGAEIYLISLAKECIKKNNNCTFFVRKNSEFSRVLSKLAFNVEIIEVSFDCTSILFSKKKIKESNFDIIHINGVNSGVFAYLVKSKTPTVTTVHSDAEQDRAKQSIWKKRLILLLEKLCLSKTDRIIAVSKSIKSMLILRGVDSEKIEVVYNGIKYWEYLKEKTFLFDPLKIVFVGRLEYVKGCEILIEALHSLEDIPFVCDIYGTGSLEQTLNELVSNYKMGDRIIFKGFSRDVRSVLKDYDILIQPSVFEAFSLTVAEAMNAKVLVICSRIGGMQELISDYETGLLFPVQSVSDLTEKIKWAYRNPEKVSRIVEKAYQEYYDKYREDFMCEKTIRVFEEVINK